jgi:excisionase family DNA binding protein
MKLRDGPLLKPRAAAAELGIGIDKLYAMIHRGEIPAVEVGSQFRISMDAVQRYRDRKKSEQ